MSCCAGGVPTRNSARNADEAQLGVRYRLGVMRLYFLDSLRR